MQYPRGFQLPASYRGHPHFWQRGLSRRQFLGASAGATAGALSSPLWLPTLVNAAASDPTPIPQTIPGTPFHVQLPGPDTELSTITNFQGVLGVAAVGGAGTATNVITGATERLLVDVDNRFMKGTYVGAGGQTYQATFAFVWMDLYRGLVDPLAPDTHQIHDFNLDIVPFPGGLFWTAKVDAASVSVDPANLGAGAQMHIEQMHLVDYHTLLNALMDGVISGEEPANVSYTLHWSGAGSAESANDGKNFRYDGVKTTATIEWSAKKSDGFHFQSDPASTSVTNFALLANEHNGSFY